MHAVFTNFLAFYHWGSLPKTRRKKQLRHQIIPTQLYIALLYWMYYQNLNIICEFYHKAVNGSMVNFLAPSIAMQSSQSFSPFTTEAICRWRIRSPATRSRGHLATRSHPRFSRARSPRGRSRCWADFVTRVCRWDSNRHSTQTGPPRTGHEDLATSKTFPARKKWNGIHVIFFWVIFAWLMLSLAVQHWASKETYHLLQSDAH